MESKGPGLAAYPLVITVCFGLSLAAREQVDPTDIHLTQQAASKAVSLLQTVGENWNGKQFCTSCHHQVLPMLALREARDHGIPVDTRRALKQLRHSLSLFQLEHAIEGWTPEMTVEQAYTLIAFAESGIGQNDTLSGYVRLFCRRQTSEGYWRFADNRPPHAYSEIDATAIVLRALRLFAPPEMEVEISQRTRRALKWLQEQQPRTSDERVFRLLGLHWAGASSETLQLATKSLTDGQNNDGGWSQLPHLTSDAYSTGEALFAINEAGNVPVGSVAYKKGISFLLKTQAEDGSWHVKSRIYHPYPISPPYFETGFPYSHDQFVSTAGTSWAVMALSRSLPKRSLPPFGSGLALLPRNLRSWEKTILYGTPEEVAKLLAGGFDPNSATSEGTTALMMAAPDVEKVRILLDAGANPKTRSRSGFDALMVASGYEGATATVRLLLNKGVTPEPLDAEPIFRSSAASQAASSGTLASLKLLAEKGADLHRKVIDFWSFENTFYGMAVMQGDVDTIDYLAKTMSYSEKNDALIASILANRPAQVKALLRNGANVNCLDEFGMTPVLAAASIDFGDTEVLRALLDANANLTARSKTGLSARDLAKKYGHTQMLKLLQ